MKDRVPNPLYVLANGAIRYGVYDEAGDLVRYEYIKKEDDPVEEGTPLGKASLLSDAAANAFESAFGVELSSDPTPDEVFRLLMPSNVVKILSVTTEAAANQIDLPVGDISGYRQLILVADGILGSAEAGETNIKFNNDSTSGHYASGDFSRVASSTAYAAATNVAISATLATSFEMVINLGENNIYGLMLAAREGTAAVTNAHFATRTTYINKGNLSTINVYCTTGGTNIVTGATFTLYGVKS